MIKRAAALTQAAFAEFGDVIEHRGEERRHMVRAALDLSDEAAKRALWVSRIWQKVSLPLEVTQLERHPNSDQAFIPLLGQPYVIVACGTRGDGMPDAGSARAFIAGPRQGVIYRRNTWHLGLSVLAEPAEFVVIMSKTGGVDEVFQNLDTPFTVLSEADAA